MEMKMETQPGKANRVIHGDCINVMGGMAASSIDMALTDPPYLVQYRSRDGRSVRHDDRAEWLQPAFSQIYRVLKPDSVCVSFYGWPKAELFLSAWREAGFRPIGHIVFRKRYSSSAGYVRYQHEQAYVLARGRPELPSSPIPDVIDWQYTGNRLHPTQKPVSALTPLIESFCRPDGVVLDPFCGSGSTLVAARKTGRQYVGIELDRRHYETSFRRTLCW